MLAKVLSGLSLVRHAVAITLVFGAAGASVAGAFDVAPSQSVTPVSMSTTMSKTQNDNTKDLEVAVKACLATKDPASDDCAKAIELSGLSTEDFWAKIALSLNEQLGRAKEQLEQAKNTKHEESTPTASPKGDKPTTTADAGALIKDCVAAYERVRQTHEGADAVKAICDRAIKASGLSADAFWAKYYPKPQATEQPKPTVKPQPTQSVSDADLKAMVKDCFAKYLAATTAKGNEDLGHAAYDACTKAMAASGLSGDAFWAKFGTPQAPKN